MRTEEVRPYYDNLKKHEKELYLKRTFDVVAASILLVLLAPILFGEPDPVSDICYPFLMEVMSRLCVLGSTLNPAARQWS